MLALVVKTSQITLLGLLVWSLYMAVAAVGGEISQAQPAPSGLDASVDAGPPRPSELDYGIIAQRGLFSAVEPSEPPPPPKPVLPPVEETELNIKLLGTVVAVDDPSDPANSANIIDIDGKPATVRVNYKVANAQAVVEAIEKGRIVISRGDRRESVSLPEVPEAPKPEIRLQPGETPLDPDDGRIVISVGPRDGSRPSRTAPSRQDLRPARALRRPQRVSPVAAATRAIRRAVTLDVDGDAVRIEEVKAGGKAEALGFQSGDRIVSINGVAITGTSIPPGLVQTFIRGGDPVVSVERAGGESDITIPREALTQPEEED